MVVAKVNGPPAAPRVTFCKATVGPLTALVKIQLICAAAKMFAAGIVSTFPAKVPNVPMLPLMPEFASVQVAVAAVKFVAGVSVTVTAVLNADTFIGVGAAGVAVPVAVVVIAGGAEARFVAENVNAPPTAPVVIFWMATVAGFVVLVKMHAMASP